jgi:hypothetical protein
MELTMKIISILVFVDYNNNFQVRFISMVRFKVLLE